MLMKTITVSVEDALYRQARIAAAEANTSVTGLVREFLTVLTTVAHTSERDGTASSAILETIDRIRSRHPGFNPAARLDREELHAR